MSDYATDEELQKIVEWGYEKGFVPLMEFVQSLWQYEDYFTKEPSGDDKVEAFYRVSTGGWSGHEDIIEALQKNHMFWTTCWVYSRRGGHYQFEVPIHLAQSEHSKRVDELKKHIEKNSIDLDELVIELKSHEASNINNSGLDDQMEYLLESGGLAWLEDSIFGKPTKE